MQCLSTLIEALILYDATFVYKLHPSEQFPDGGVFDRLISEGGIRFVDPYYGWPREERRPYLDLDSAYLTANGRGAAFSALECPKPVLERNRLFLDRIGESEVREILASLGAGNEIETVAAEERTYYLRRCAGKVIWQIETAREVAKNNDAAGVIVPPQCYSMWKSERESMTSALAAQFALLQEAIKLHHCGDDVGLDLSPLTVIVLDTAIEREGLIENILMVRRDYQELRVIGSQYQQALSGSESYRQISEVVNEWRDAWNRVLNDARSGRTSLVRKLFSWDVVKKGSMKGMLFEAAAITGREISDVVLRKRLTIASRIESEFLSSAPVRRSIKRLFKRPESAR